MKATNTMTTNIRKHTQGRGSNPRSRTNLRTPVRDWYVYSRGAGIGWSVESGPHFQGHATETATRMEQMNHSQVRPMYVASKGVK